MRKLFVTAIFVSMISAGIAAGQATPPGSAHWPTVAQQVAQAGAKHGTALEALIMRYGPEPVLTSKLFPQELNDGRNIPYWLRTYWREQHPETRCRIVRLQGGGFDRTYGGCYPLVLHEVYEWMQSHQNFDNSRGQGSDELESMTFAAGTNVRLSGAQSSPRSESDIRVNYWNPNLIIGASNNISSSGQQAQWFSTDGGQTWNQNYLPLQSSLGDAFMSDPTVDWTSDGTAWSTTIGINSGGSVLHMRAYKSTDNGASWNYDATFSGSQTSTDKQMIWTDHSNSSPYKDNIYAIYHNGAPAYISRHTGSGWGSPLKVSGSETTGTAIGADIKSNSYGDVVGMWPDTGSKKIYLVKSTNGGSSWSSPATVASTYGSFQIAIPADASRQVLIASIVGVYRTSSTNNVYVVWNDLSGDSGCTSGGGPGTNASSTCKTRVFFQRSTDGGNTWSAKVKINNQSGLNDQFFPWMVVDETTGKIGVTYYDTVGDSSRTSANIYYQSSNDGGQTWTTPLKVTTASTNETTSGADSGNQYGDYATVSGINGQFWPSWTDRRSGGKEEIWSAKVIDDSGSSCTPPAAPTGVSASSSSQSGATVSWTASSGATSYIILRSNASGGPYSQAGTSTSTSFTDTGLSCNTTYYYVVQASNGTCASGNSAQAQATTSTCSSGGALTASYDSSRKAPSCGSTVGTSCDTGASLILGRDSLSGGAEPNQPNTINSSCADGSSGSFHSDESLDRLEIETTDGSSFAAGKSVKVTATVWTYSTYSSDHLDLYYAADASNPTWTLIGTINPTGSGAQTLTATYTLPAGSMQAIRGTFRYNGSASSCTTGSYDDHDDLIFAVGGGSGCTPPAAPTGVSARSSSQTSATVSWNASSGATSYSILRSTTSGGPYTQAGTSTSTSFSDSGLTCNTTYYYVVQASNGTCASGNSSQAQATTASCPCTPPAAPTGVGASSSSQTSATVSWNASSGATSYAIFRSTTSGGPYSQAGTSTSTSFSDSGLTCNTTYYYVVQASNGTCASGNSAQAQATTAACGGGGALTATYDSSRKAPSCGSTVGTSCDTGASL
ncbi:MAG: fibronectin type III domain-containing protein, partial [Thermoanaerobaculia bacterium]